jgi:hypothetical protein
MRIQEKHALTASSASLQQELMVSICTSGAATNLAHASDAELSKGFSWLSSTRRWSQDHVLTQSSHCCCCNLSRWQASLYDRHHRFMQAGQELRTAATVAYYISCDHFAACRPRHMVSALRYTSNKPPCISSHRK